MKMKNITKLKRVSFCINLPCMMMKKINRYVLTVSHATHSNKNSQKARDYAWPKNRKRAEEEQEKRNTHTRAPCDYEYDTPLKKQDTPCAWDTKLDSLNYTWGL